MGQLILDYGESTRNNTIPKTLEELNDFLGAHYSAFEVISIILDE